MLEELTELVTFGPNEAVQGTIADPWHWNAGYFGLGTGVLLHMVNGVSEFLFRNYNANILLLHAGTNDSTVLTPAQCADNIVAIAQQFLADKPTGMAFVMPTIFGGSGMTSLNAFVTALRPLIVSGLSGTPRAFIATPPSIPDSDYLGGAVGIHPLDAGYALMADDGLGNGWAPAMRAQGF